MKKRWVLAALAFFLAAGIPAGAADDGVTVTVRDGYACDYGVNIPFTRSSGTVDYTFSLFEGTYPSGAPEVTAAVEVTPTSQVNVYLPLRYDPAGPSTWTLKVTAHAAPGRAAFDREATAVKSFTTTPTCGCPAGTAGAYYAGDGSVQSPFRVSAREQLDHVENHLSASFLQVNDIDGGGSFASISNFRGTYDGGWHRIRGLNEPVFAQLTGATVQRLGIEDSTALFSPYRETQGRNSGALASTLDGSIIRDCYALNCSVSGYQAGGLVGWFNSSTIERCYALGVEAVSCGYPGGLVSRSDGRLQITDCYAVPASLASTEFGTSALFGESTGGAVALSKSYWCTSAVSNGVGEAFRGGSISVDSYSRGYPLEGFSSLGNFTGFDEANWTIRSMAVNTASGSVTAGVPVLRKFYE
ncbi:hypothetical protein [Harryflintia acetispora]|uniref:hypothetical protein n=1 Tax=Harryflintia acetispora TaxID=1849041 RepID=UPI00189A7F3B|nr:hypothetical protein [Harryflintia acetispora]